MPVLRPLSPSASRGGYSSYFGGHHSAGGSHGSSERQTQGRIQGDLASLAKHTSKKVNWLEQMLGEEIANIQMGQRRQFDTLDTWLKQLETARVQQLPAASASVTPLVNCTSISDSSLPAPETYLPLTILLVATNPAWQNPRLIGQALSVTPPLLRFFWLRDSAVLVEDEDEQRLVLGQGSIFVCSNEADVSPHGQLIGTVNCFLYIWVTAGKISAGEETEYLDNL